MRTITESDREEPNACYLPHHSVLKEDAKSTKLRVVFDGSCKTSTGLALNDCMPVGPVVQSDLISILLRFRTYRYVLVADIVKMYRQILLHPSQTHLQRILWREDKRAPVQAFELLTLTYGTTIASYLATRCLVDLADQFTKEFPVGSLHLRRNFYVDDLLTGADTKAEALSIRDELIQLLKLGFKLSKWGSNCSELLNGINDQSEHLITFTKDENFRILGTSWDRNGDTLQFSLSPSLSANASSKRIILSEVSRLIDPLGLLGPVIVLAKLILQELWQAGIEWDESIPQHVHTKWMQLKLQLPSLNLLKIPRWSRVAPLKSVSLPRLELSAALLLARLVHKIKSALEVAHVETFLWSDSTIALNWIASASRRWSTFVANRVGEIQRLTEHNHWGHVSSTDNPADPLSRGLLPDDIIKSKLWWHGPTYLSLPMVEWPSGDFPSLGDEGPEQRKIYAAVISKDFTPINKLIARFSNLNKTLRITAYCLRLAQVKALRPATVAISPGETIQALNSLCKAVQNQSFFSEYEALSNARSIAISSNMNSLSPFLDDDGLIRVGGRIKNSALSFDASHQIILPRHHPLTKLIIQYEHIRNFYAGLQATMAAVRQRFWPLSLRSAVRKIINNCIKCFKARSSISEAEMACLPSPRVTVSRPFTHCGVDYAGPVTLREGRRRNSRNHKAYVAAFVCFSTKAVHLELVSDLTTDAFIASLRRLIARRGRPERMYSDNATTFVGAQRQIKEFYEFLRNDEVQNSINRFLLEQHTTWAFIPPNAPHFGGLWEAAIKSAKFYITRIIGGSHLTYEEFQTISSEIEAILNSRPLQPLSSDPNDMSYLSPGHFLVGTTLNSFPHPDLTNVNLNRLQRWQVVQQMRQHFWARWSAEYLSSLQERHKWKRNKGPQLEPGQLVLIKQAGLAPLQWLTGRVESVHPGPDGVSRTATVKTSKGSYVRPLSKLAILPI
ncbi:uncharacterized protein LOC118645802 [Monomorium pharaonis]|uniref:uncharacterized protein LOC118645802 n=1 Tax=Monomorium pharaonis TaxID=307658 RepID=UPI001746EAC2|nr:uncharacterized protein LOC118645802 [Monomorium pharaonis]